MCKLKITSVCGLYNFELKCGIIKMSRNNLGVHGNNVAQEGSRNF